MSLLNDALKRAKQEALEREAEGRTDYGLPTPRERKSRSRLGLLSSVGVVVALAGAGAFLGWLLARAGDDRAAEPSAAGELLRPAIESMEPPEGAEVAAAVESSSVAPAAEPELVEGQQEASAGGASEARPREARGAVAGPEPAPVVVTPPPPGAGSDDAGQLTDGASFVRLLDLAGVRLELQGIAFQGGSSVAIINDLMVAPEDMVEGFRVIAIDPERVQLQGRGVTLYLTLH